MGVSFCQQCGLAIGLTKSRVIDMNGSFSGCFWLVHVPFVVGLGTPAALAQSTTTSSTVNVDGSTTQTTVTTTTTSTPSPISSSTLTTVVEPGEHGGTITKSV